MPAITGSIVSCDQPNTSDDSIIRMSSRKWGVPSVKRMPSFRSASGVVSRFTPDVPKPRRNTMCALDAMSAQTIPAYIQPMPKVAVTGPATNGMVMPAQVMATKLAAFALSRFSRPATSSTSVMRAGSLTAINMPSASAVARMCQSSIRSVNTSSATAAKMAACAVCATTNSTRRSSLSAITPAKPAHSIIPNPAMPDVAPTQNAESVTCSASQPCARMYMVMPTSLNRPAIQSKRNLALRTRRIMTGGANREVQWRQGRVWNPPL